LAFASSLAIAFAVVVAVLLVVALVVDETKGLASYFGILG